MAHPTCRQRIFPRTASAEKPAFCSSADLSEQRYLDLLTNLVEAYEEEHYPIRDASPVDVLRTLMEANHLKQKDLASIFGAESTVSEVLHGTRQLNLSHIERLSDRFNLSPEVLFRRHTKHMRERTVEE